MSKKLEKIARLYRIDLSAGKQGEQNVPASPVVTTLSPETELARLTNEFQQARQRLNNFLVRQKAQRRAARLGQNR